MTPPINSFSSYRKRLAKANVPLLGHLVFFTVAENVCVDHEDFAKDCDRLDFGSYTPKSPKDADVFRRVCTNAARKRVPTDDPERFENYLVRDVRASGGHFWKQLVVETVDSSDRRLSYEPVLELEFDPKKPTRIVVNWLKDPNPTSRAILTSITSEYKHWRGKVHAYSIRSFIRDIVNSEGLATSVKQSGGLYFVASTRLDVIERLDEIVEKYAGTDRAIALDTVPLIDDSRTKEMLKAAFEDEAVRSITEFQKEVDDLIASDGKITDAKFATLAKRKNEIKDKAKEYAELLDDNLNGTTLRMKSLESTLKRAYNRIAS